MARALALAGAEWWCQRNGLTVQNCRMRCRLLTISVLGLSAFGCSGDNSGGPPQTVATSVSAAPTLSYGLDLVSQTGTAYALDWSADGATLAVSQGVELSLLREDAVLVLVAALEPASGALAATASPDGTRYATVAGSHNPTINVWDWDADALQLTLTQEVAAGADQFAVSWSPDGTLLASLANDRESVIQVWDTATWELVNEYELPYANPRRALNWSADSTLIYDAGESDGQAVYFAMDVADGAVTELGRLPIEEVIAFAISSDGMAVAVADNSGNVQILDVTTEEMLTEFQSVAEPADMAWNPIDGTLAVLSYQSNLQIWSIY